MLGIPSTSSTTILKLPVMDEPSLSALPSRVSNAIGPYLQTDETYWPKALSWLTENRWKVGAVVGSALMIVIASRLLYIFLQQPANPPSETSSEAKKTEEDKPVVNRQVTTTEEKPPEANKTAESPKEINTEEVDPPLLDISKIKTDLQNRAKALYQTIRVRAPELKREVTEVCSSKEFIIQASGHVGAYAGLFLSYIIYDFGPRDDWEEGDPHPNLVPFLASGAVFAFFGAWGAHVLTSNLLKNRKPILAEPDRVVK